MLNNIGFKGHITWVLHGPDGEIISQGSGPNLITQVGDQMYGERGASVAGALAAPTGMKLGTGNTAPSKTGAGAALATYLGDSHQGFDTGYPSSSLVSTSRRITYQVVWGPGKATTSGAITEVVLINDALANATSADTATIARALISGVGSKGAIQTLTVTWVHDLLGA